MKEMALKECRLKENAMSEITKAPIGRVLILNGSAHESGTTRAAIDTLAATLESEGITSEIITLGKLNLPGCQECYACGKLKRCVIDDEVNVLAEKLRECDGIVLASPVFYAAPNGQFLAILDRLFYSSRFDKSMKVGASVVVARRGGCTASFDVLNKYFAICGMPIATANYWNQVHGGNYEAAQSDEEGMQTMRILGRNMAFLIRAIKLAKETIPLPEGEKKIYTSFIR